MDHPPQIRTVPVIMKPVFLYLRKLYFSISTNSISMILKQGSQRVLWSIMDNPLEIRAVPVIMKHVFLYFCTLYFSVSAVL